MQDFSPINSTELVSSSRTKINNNEESLASHFSGTYFPTNNLAESMYCWRTDLKKMYQLGADLVSWTLVNDMSQGYNSVAHANRADYATKDADGNDIRSTYYKNDNLPDLKDALFPVGSIYLTMTNTNPSTWLGGEWQQIAGGRTLLGASSSFVAGSMGGKNALPYHRHTFTGNAVTSSTESANHTHSGTTGNGTNSYLSKIETSEQTSYSTSNVTIGTTGTSGWLRSGEESGGGKDQVLRFTNSAANHTHTFTTGNQSTHHTHSVTATGTISYEGSSNTDVYPPYLCIYIWQRVK